ncbi:hypothetical protein [Paraburkholderia sp.]
MRTTLLVCLAACIAMHSGERVDAPSRQAGELVRSAGFDAPVAP